MTNLANEFRTIVLNLENRLKRKNPAESFDKVQFALNNLKLKIDANKVVLVSGNNGKGSVCATLEALLRHAGKRVGVSLSPHLISVTERIRLNGKEVSRSTFCQAHYELEKIFVDESFDFYEWITLLAVWIFFSGKYGEPVDYAVFEARQGGLWDVANPIPHKNCVITRLFQSNEKIDIKTLREIAKHQYGTITRNAKVVHLKAPDRWNPLLSAIKEKTKSKWAEVSDIDFEVFYRKREVTFSLISKWGQVELVLAGPRGVENTLLALQMFEELGFDPREHLEALKKVHFPCRMQRIDEYNEAQCPIFLSGDYTIQGIMSLVELLDYYPRKNLHILIGVNMDQEVDQILSPLFKIKDAHIYLTRSPRRSLPLRSYGKWHRKAVGAWASPKVALDKIAKVAHREDMILVTGSLELVGRVKEFITEKPQARKRDALRELSL